jgi:DNA-binding LytR/AlgR family response regulator
MPAVLKYLIVDDEDIDRLALETYASAFTFLHQIAACSNALEAIELINRFQPDIVFADIEMPGMTGLEMFRSVVGQVTAPVFVTSHPEFAVDGYELEAFDYLVKPLSKERFTKCINRLQDFFQLREKAAAFEKEDESNFITVRQGYDKYKINIHDIMYLEAMKDYTKLVTASGHYLILCTLTGMHEKLSTANFIRVHRSYIVNCKRIDAIKGNKIFIFAHELPVGKLYKKDLDERFD